MREKVIEVTNLTISFRTPNGLVRAVRDIDFDLYRGETLAIVGESGSGKSVTNRAIMGILAGNAIIDDGKIIYHNQDLTKLSEANFHLVRGNKIGMIFQDPLSSLNPIMRIGKQITEAMLVNGNRKKIRLLDLYHVQYHDYLNMKTAIKLAKKDFKAKEYEISLESELNKEQKKAQVEEARKKKKEKISLCKSQMPGLRKIYIAAKKDARKQVKQEFGQIDDEANRQYENVIQKIKKQRKIISDIEKANPDGASRERKELEKLIVQKKAILETNRRAFKVTRKEAREKALQIMNEVGIPEPEKRFKQYPFQFSGGMRQRIVIAIALTCNPEVLICDEPTTALDVTIQEQILSLIKDIKKERDLSVIFITHDLGVVANMADRVAVMYGGKIVEYGTTDEIFYDPKHPYTWALLSSVPDLETKDRLLSIPGNPPDMLFPPKGDAFAERNKYALKIDFEEQPPFFKVTETHYAATWLLHEDAPKIEMPSIIKERVSRYGTINEPKQEAKTKEKAGDINGKR